ncbi:hypothetical protein OEG84_11430 [Hoeflea sp. G2-23]|uniref:Uncharacterized protein n=1 Tax=Hoeflea algicola TaxID=2983763 RepID=A0ABT3Z9A0_9HYPH|nr:hypothetical protein [Hoeflea algicola]MCY0148304.1 hypothetical protein [Hoeflea algicola]
MPVRSSGYFNNPAFAQAASNLTALFAPPSGADAAGWANANAKKAEAARLQMLFDNPNDPNFDRRNIAVGNYNPTQSFYAQDQNNATTMRGQDVTAATSRSNNAADNVRALTERQMQEAAAMERLGITNATDMRGQDITANTSLTNNAADNARALQANQQDNLTKLFGPLNEGQVRPDIPPEIAAALGLDQGLPAVQGNAAPLTETEVVGQNQQRLIDSGQLTDQMLLDNIMGKQSPVEAVGPNGEPVFMNPGAAVRTGAEAFINKGAEAALTNGMAVVNGRNVAVVQDRATGKWVEAQTGTPIPAGIEVLKPSQVTGSADEVGLTTGTKSDVQKNILAIDETVATATTLRDLIAANPSSQGIVGSVRKLAQNLFQTANELGQNAGPGVKQITDAVQQGLLDQDTAAQYFDPGLEAIDLLTNYLAWQYAKTMGGDRVSNEQLKQARDAIGGSGLLANNAASAVRLNQIIEQMGAQRNRLGAYAPDMKAAPVAGARRRFNPATGQIE